jgi:Phosphotransferase enzyme family
VRQAGRVPLDTDAVCATFDLGLSSGPPIPLTGGSSATRWMLRTDRGGWMVKATSSPATWQLSEMRVSAVLERAAYGAGVSMPRPVEPHGPGVGYWARLGEAGMWARVSEWIDGTAASAADLSLAAWLGRTLARLERLALPGDHTGEAAYPVHSAPDWHHWLDEATTAGVLGRQRTPDVLAAVTAATSLVEAALAAGQVFQLAHRDVNRRNILITGRGPSLLDFDYAGPEVPWWEFVHHAFDLASPSLGDYPPRPDEVRVALSAYVEEGATAGPAGPEAFAGLLRAALGGLAYNLWLAVGHRPVDETRRTVAARAAQQLAGGLPTMVNSIESWTRLIR